MKKVMAEAELTQFLNGLRRAELETAMKDRNLEFITAYLKAVRVTLWSLGYDDAWVNGPFRDRLENEYNPMYVE